MNLFAGRNPPPARVAAPPYEVEVNFGLSPARQRELRPELTAMLHQTFLNHPPYDRDNLPHFLASDIYLRVFRQGELAGIFCSELLLVAGRPALHLILALSRPGRRGGGVRLTVGLNLDLAAQAFGTAEFLVGLRTANPRVVAFLFKCPWVRFYPRPDWEERDPAVEAVRREFCARAFGADRCSLDGVRFYGIYNAPLWGGKIPWHHDQAVNDFCREQMYAQGAEALFFLGPTLPAVAGLPRRATWPKAKG